MILIFAIISILFCARVNGVSYTENTIVSEYLELYENDRLLLEIIEKNNDTTAYMTITDPISADDDIRVSVIATRFDGIEFPLPGNSIKLCELLTKDSLGDENKGLTQFMFSGVFNLDGMVCPLLPMKKRLTPYMFPSSLTLYNDMGCGEFVYKITIEDCQGKTGYGCAPLISAVTTVVLNAHNCSNTLI